jgi:hypothetical protein
MKRGSLINFRIPVLASETPILHAQGCTQVLPETRLRELQTSRALCSLIDP